MDRKITKFCSSCQTLGLIMLLGSMFCYLSFEYIGSEVLANGVLVEPFFLIPIGYMLAFIGILLLLISLIRKKVKNK